MRIGHLRISHLEKPLGFWLEKPEVSWIVEESTGKKQEAARIEVSLDEDFGVLVYDSGKREDLCSLGSLLDIECMPRTRYYVRVTVWADDGDTCTSPATWFETGKMSEAWEAKWIQAPFDKEVHPLFQRTFNIPGKIKSARAYATGLGVYEIYFNGQKAGNEYLAPFYNDYNLWVQYQTYDITGLLTEGENAVGAMLGNGWYKGRFGFMPDMKELYGDRMQFLAEIRITLEDGTEMVVGTDENWQCHPSPVLESSIYNGEVYDSRKEVEGFARTDCDMSDFVMVLPADAPKGKLMERMSPPLTIQEKIVPKLIHTPAGEQVLDFEQVMTGWMEFECDIPENEEIYLQCGELLQYDNFYNENLRTAKEELRYISNGKKAHVRPHFTFYGFRYIKVTGLEEVNPEDFVGYVIHSELGYTGKIETSNDKVNKLIHNALWGQKGNFLDVPTDCPQRDERMGWTGDAQAFAATACFNMYTPAFYRKFLYDMLLEQREQEGSVPHVVPDVLGQIRTLTGIPEDMQNGSCAWGDAATVIPWTLYVFYGDKSLLKEQYENMKAWTDFIKVQDETRCGGRRLWSCGFHFADWLALDNLDRESSFGGTDCYYVASAYYYYSSVMTAKAAAVLGKEADAAYYGQLAEEVKAAIRKEYFTETGRIAVDTQTAMVLALYMGFVPEEHRDRLVADLKKKLEDNKLHLNTGFVGTCYLCPTLSVNGLAEYAYTLLLNEDFPSWLYEVNMGATTVWERWNSVMPDGLVSDTGMNSMNHYAYGAIVEWMYRFMAGINPVEEAPGFKKAVIRPQTDRRFEWVDGVYESASGTYRCGWKQEEDGITYEVEVPFDAEAEFIVEPGLKDVRVGQNTASLQAVEGKILLTAGKYKITAKR